MRVKTSAVILPFALVLASCGYNRIQTMDEQANAARSQIEVQLQRRADLIPNLVSTVKGYAAHEDEIFTKVAEARSALLNAVQSHDPEQMAAANQQTTSALGRLLAISENYPQLKADQSFIRLQDELTGTENRIAVARRNYIEAVRAYNTALRTFPTVIWAKTVFAGNKPMAEFAAIEGSEKPPPVKF